MDPGAQPRMETYAVCKAWNRLLAETGRITSLCSHPWIMEVKP